MSSAVILSTTPLPGAVKSSFQQEYRGEVEFHDLAALRRRGIKELFRGLRAIRARDLIVTGQAEDFRLFKDYLLLLSLLAKADRRVLDELEGGRRGLSVLSVPAACVRIGVGIATGFLCLLLNRWRVARYSGVADSRPVAATSFSRCLYLKPMLMFGQVVGGSVGHIAGVANAFRRRGAEVRLLSSHGQQLLDEPVEQVRVPPSSLAAFPHELNQHVYQNLFLRAATRELREFKPDFIYQRYSLNDLTGLELRRRFGVPLILEFNGSEVWVQRHWGKPLRFSRLSERIEAANLRNADLVVVVSEEIKRMVIEAGVAEDRVFFYPNCIDPRLFSPDGFDEAGKRRTREGLGVPLDADLFTFVGTFGLWHGTEVLAQAVRRLIDTSKEWLRERGIHFLFVGDGARAEAVRSILGRDLGAPFVTLAGLRPQPETPAILAASDVLLSPHAPNPDGSPFFGSPTKLFEYMAMEKPIIASDLDQIGRILKGWAPGAGDAVGGEGEELALLVEPGDVDSLISAIRNASGLSEESRKALGVRARAHVLRAFTWEKNVTCVLAALSQISTGRLGEAPPKLPDTGSS